MTRLKKYLVNGLLLTSVSFFLRFLGVSFNIYISNRIGAEAMGLFTLIGSVYTFALTFALSGINLATTRIISDAIALNDENKVKKSMQLSFMYALVFGILSSIILFSFAGKIGTAILEDERTIKPLRIMAISLPLISMTSAMNGYFNAVRRVYKGSVVQICEQIISIALSVFFTELIFAKDITSACISLCLGSCLSEIISFFISLFLYLFDRDKYKGKISFPVKKSENLKKLLSIALPLAFSTYFRSALLTIEHIFIPIGLRKSGATKSSSLATYGTLSCMVMPIILFPSALIYSFASLLIPEFAELKIKKNHIEIEYVAKRVLHIALIFSIGVSGIMICFSKEMGNVIYNSVEAGNYITIIAPIIPIMYLDSTVDAMLKGLGHHIYSMNVNIIDSLLSLFLVIILIPKYAINGYIAMIFISETLNFGLSATKLFSIAKIKFDFFKSIISPTISIVLATVISNLTFSIFNFIKNGVLKLSLHIILSTVIYIFLLNIFKSISKEDKIWIKNIISKKNQAI